MPKIAAQLPCPHALCQNFEHGAYLCAAGGKIAMQCCAAVCFITKNIEKGQFSNRNTEKVSFPLEKQRQKA